MKAPKVNDDALQLGGALAKLLNHDKPHWPNTVTGSRVACIVCQWYSGEKFIPEQIKTSIICNVNLCVKQFSLFHMIRMLVEDKEKNA